MNTKTDVKGGAGGTVASGLPFELAGGTVTGRAHLAAGRNNQDAFCWAVEPEGLVAVVCDGCSSGPRSEVGAQLGSRLLVEAVRRRFRMEGDVAALLEDARRDVLASLRGLVEAMGGASLPRTATDHFLFTVVGALVTAGAVTTFSLGDGLVVINGDRAQLGPFPNNEPPYLGYALLPGAREDLPFTVHHSMATCDLQSLMLGTDGAVELDSIAAQPVQGRDEAIGPLTHFWSDDRVFKNADIVRRRLAMINRGPRGPLADDTTLVAIRRKVGEG